MYKFLLYLLCFSVAGNAHAQQPTDTFKLYFDLGVPSLSQKMQKKIDLLIYNDKILHGSQVTIVGYCDFLGGEDFNKSLSMKRAENVKQYLVTNGINEKDITLCIGRGKIDRAGMTDRGGYPTDRRVDIVMNNYTGKQPPPTSKTKPGKTTTRKDALREVTITNMKEIKTLRPGTIFKLNNVYFPADRHVMKPESEETLENLYEALKANPNIKIRIEGHVCCILDAPDALDVDTYEPQLSVNRAKAIYKYLIDRGIEPSRLTYAGFGRRRPVIEFERSEEDAEKNRRVEIRIVQND